jgi:TfoX/Sxy family transcriptional regulator of competence genes
MASDPSQLDHVLDLLAPLPGLTQRRMFGEYALYHFGKVVAFLCDNRLYLKPTEAGRAAIGAVTEGFPYPGAKPHFLVDELLDDRERLIAAWLATSAALPEPKPKPKPGPKPGPQPKAAGPAAATRAGRRR